MAYVYTPHIRAEEDVFAPTVLMPGDPKRAKFIAENFLTDAVLVNDIRGVQGHTGFYKGKKVSVMASGMGMPSIAIYAHELYHMFHVETIIRVGTAGSTNENVRPRDVVAAMSAHTNSNFGEQFGFQGTLSPCCSVDLLMKANEAAKSLNIPLTCGTVFSSDNFYDIRETPASMMVARLGSLCVEMETYALYLTAARAGKKALSLLTISDSLITGESLDAEQRRSSFTDMMKIALEIA